MNVYSEQQGWLLCRWEVLLSVGELPLMGQDLIADLASADGCRGGVHALADLDGVAGRER